MQKGMFTYWNQPLCYAREAKASHIPLLLIPLILSELKSEYNFT